MAQAMAYKREILALLLLGGVVSLSSTMMIHVAKAERRQDPVCSRPGVDDPYIRHTSQLQFCLTGSRWIFRIGALVSTFIRIRWNLALGLKSYLRNHCWIKLFSGPSLSLYRCTKCGQHVCSLCVLDPEVRRWDPRF